VFAVSTTAATPVSKRALSVITFSASPTGQSVTMPIVFTGLANPAITSMTNLVGNVTEIPDVVAIRLLTRA
jgi:hypothetical protein